MGPRQARWGLPLRIVWALLLMALAGCSTLGYYAEAINGHVSVLRAARPIDDWLTDPATPEILKRRLEQVRAIRAFASNELGLPNNSSYRTYADLHRPFVVWNVMATPSLSLELKKWCFPFAGCVTYRGYFDKDDAQAFAAQLRSEGLDVLVGGVPAYSTLGWTADPVLSTFIKYPEAEVARLIFHELAHEEFYLPGDSTFNESYATTVEQEGVRRWLVAQNNPAMTQRYETFERRKDTLFALLENARENLSAAYTAAKDDAMRRADKEQAFAALRLAYRTAKADPSNPLYHFNGYDDYFARDLNNALLASIATYTQRIPAFVKLLAEQNGNLPRFYDAVRALAKLDKPQREARLDALESAVTASRDVVTPVR